MNALRGMAYVSFAVISAVGWAAEAEFTTVAKAWEDSVVKIEAKGWAKSGRYTPLEGTGFFVSDGGFLLTAGHVVRPPTGWDETKDLTIQVFALNEQRQVAEVPGTPVLLYVDEQVDLALLRLIGSSYAGLPLANSGEVQDGDFMGILAFGEGRNTPWPGKGEIQQVFRPEVLGLMDLHITGLIRSDSGSPLLNEEGQVIGVLVKGWDKLEKLAPEGEVFGVPINSAAPLLSMAGRNHPTALDEWLRGTPLEATIQELETAIGELKTTWTFEPALVRRGTGDRLEVVIRKPLEAGVWPNSVRWKIAPTVYLEPKGRRGTREERTLHSFSGYETFDWESRLATQFLQIKELNRYIRDAVEEELSSEEGARFEGSVKLLNLEFLAELKWNGNQLERTVNQVVSYE